MTIKVLFFASLADITGMREIELESSSYPNVGAIYDRFTKDFPSLEAHRASVLFAINSEFAKPDAGVSDGDEVAFFPPVSGG
jgi:molybdopterin converting factor subunit 1